MNRTKTPIRKADVEIERRLFEGRKAHSRWRRCLKSYVLLSFFRPLVIVHVLAQVVVLGVLVSAHVLFHVSYLVFSPLHMHHLLMHPIIHAPSVNASSSLSWYPTYTLMHTGNCSPSVHLLPPIAWLCPLVVSGCTPRAVHPCSPRSYY